VQLSGQDAAALAYHACQYFLLKLIHHLVLSCVLAGMTANMAAHTKVLCCAAQEGVANHNEVYGVCPDQVVSDAKWHKAGDLRATVAPFLANMTIGPNNFKWMLFGDDDTVFLIDNVLHLVPHLDPTVPYFMTDHLWYPQPPGELLSQRLHSADVLRQKSDDET